MKRTLAVILLPLLIIGCDFDELPEFPTVRAINYKQEMRDFVGSISRYAKGIDPEFVIIPQNGVELVTDNGRESGSIDIDYVNAVDGLGQESLFFGLNGIDQPTPLAERRRLQTFLDLARDNGKAILVTDFAVSQNNIDDSYLDNEEAGYISFAADHAELDNIPLYPPEIHNRNFSDIDGIRQARNFLNLINPRLFSTRQELVDEISETDYDIVIIDFFFNGLEFTEEQVEQLKVKTNGSRRLLIAYMSIGLAQDNRFYWQSFWLSNPPVWLGEEVPGLPGNYHVDYWRQGWQELIFGNDESYVFRILDAGFDGVFLDNVDVFEFFEERDD
ncbi:endo alpha-1,4 polygalactosaminidase [Microbulbifer marinus]|uniref:Glycoside-hydrolase family GH114 TIM-barrel domain-containing protein n=1 Tax=Microbulbifer marinus TaxID=658218 RepID=A0A1H3W8M2_9GAMM|nr:endo alpha-1,4 polygalactosaminidase [Microbulbifer marinus]SDZ83443.1 cysteinyl-tRNA synthetase, unknown class [Microbulbifer marinus]